MGAFAQMPTPFEGFRIYKLDRHRLRLPKEIADLLPWWESEGCDALAMASPHGGLVVLSPEAKKARNSSLEQMDEEPALTLDGVGSRAFTRGLRLRATWSVRIGRDGRFTLPEDARDAGIVPSSPDAQVGVVVFWGAVQVWSLEDVPAALRALAHA